MPTLLDFALAAWGKLKEGCPNYLVRRWWAVLASFGLRVMRWWKRCGSGVALRRDE
jgi:hypothetical protein